jgi:hypothetical protein
VPGVSIYSIQTGSVALSAAATKSMWLANPATDGFVPAEIGVSFDSSAAATAPRVDLYRTTTLGSPAGTSATIVKFNDPNSASATTTGLTALSAEPTAVEVLATWFVQPAGGLFVLQYPLGREPGAVAAGQRIGLRVVTATGVTPNCVSYLLFQEG